MRQAWRVLAGILAAGAFAGGSAALADDGPGNRGDRGDRQGRALAPTLVFTLDATPASAALNGNPEGVAVDKRTGTFFVSRTGTGAIFRGTLDDPTRTLAQFIAGVSTTRSASPLATGLKVRGGKLYVAGATTGEIRVYDAATGALLGTIPTRATGDTAPTFINDLDVTGDGDIFATDSFRQVIYRVDGDTGALSTIDLTGKIAFVPTGANGQPAFNLNGIVARGDDELIVVNSTARKLFRIRLDDDDDGDDDRGAPDVEEITLRGGSITGGDGLLIDRGRLIVVQGNPAALVFIKLRHHRTRGTVEATRTDPTLAGPSTVARARDRLLVVNANFGGPPNGPFTVSALDRSSGRGHGGGGNSGRG
jgi:sugar lactone lactonase YvrE